MTNRMAGCRTAPCRISYSSSGKALNVACVFPAGSEIHETSSNLSMILIDIPGFYHKSLGVRKLSCAVPVVALCCVAADSAIGPT